MYMIIYIARAPAVVHNGALGRSSLEKCVLGKSSLFTCVLGRSFFYRCAFVRSSLPKCVLVRSSRRKCLSGDTPFMNVIRNVISS